MKSTFILAIDQGTTGTTALLVDVSDKDPNIVGRSTVEFPQHYPQAGWVEHDLDEIWHSVVRACGEACVQAEEHSPEFRRHAIVALGITNQRETLCVYDRKTLAPLTRAIVWQCRRSASLCQRLKKDGAEEGIRKQTGLFLDPYFTGTKIKWLMENREDLARKINDGAALLGTIDTFLMSKLTHGASHVTEASNASRTLLYNIHTGAWDKDLLKMMGLSSADALPEVKDSYGSFGETKGLGFLPDGIPIAGVLGDQQAALAGQRCFKIGEAKCTYGTGAFLLLNLGDKPLASDHGLLTTVAWQVKGTRTYALEGSAFIAGAAFQFIRDNLGFLGNVADSAALANEVQAAPDIYFVPALAGLGAPWWDPLARGAFFGLTRGTSKAQLVRATLEGVAFQVCDLLASMKNDMGRDLSLLRVDGGAAANNLLLNLQAQFARLPVERPHSLETTSLGAALFAGLGVGRYGNVEELHGSLPIEERFQPSQALASMVEKQKQGWQRAIQAVRLFAGEGEEP
ncbi:MAG: glycerol kinase GlpK [Deltaproteobacteria bacterium]|nr:glycerol kinase GlpK [Deltaproteobacteria bacterium]